MADSSPQIDLTRIPFPSDRLSLGGLRKLYPDLFDRSAGAAAAFFDDTRPQSDLSALVNLERQIADSVFAAAVAGRPASPAVTAGEAGRVMDGWQQFGLAAGPSESKQMLRGLIAAASAQAREHHRGRDR